MASYSSVIIFSLSTLLEDRFVATFMAILTTLSPSSALTPDAETGVCLSPAPSFKSLPQALQGEVRFIKEDQIDEEKLSPTKLKSGTL